MLVHIPVHAYPPEEVSHHIDSAADTLVSLSIREFYNNERC